MEFLLLSCFVLLVKMAEGGCPNIINRQSWGALQKVASPLVVNPPPYVIVHHTHTPSCVSQNACSKAVQSIQNFHIDNRKWDDIGYNFLVGEDGNIYEGRGWGKSGAHAPNYNGKSIGISFIGNFASNTPNNAALNAAKDLISCGIAQGKIKSDYKLLGHRQVRDTECPGNSLYQEIKKWPQWTASP